MRMFRRCSHALHFTFDVVREYISLFLLCYFQFPISCSCTLHSDRSLESITLETFYGSADDKVQSSDIRRVVSESLLMLSQSGSRLHYESFRNSAMQFWQIWQWQVEKVSYVQCSRLTLFRIEGNWGVHEVSSHNRTYRTLAGKWRPVTHLWLRGSVGMTSQLLIYTVIYER